MKQLPEYYRKTYAWWYNWFAYIYDPFAQAFCFIFNGGFGGERRFREKIVAWIDPRPGDKILDLCSGTGTLSILLAERLAGTGEVVGIELSPVQMKIARRKRMPEGLTFIEGDARDVPYPVCYFDKVVICTALHELPGDVRQRVLLEVYRVIRPGGILVVSEQNTPHKKWKAVFLDCLERLNPEYATYKDLQKCGLENEIGRAGFTIMKTDSFMWDLFQIVLAEK
jgi:ubiquinone/menaquinone biosynthesis C-methylase UbiE